MKGLIIKDLLSSKGLLSVLAIGAAMMFFYSFLDIDVTAFVVFFIGLLVSVNMFEFDVRNNWDQLAITLPVRRRDIVTARYIFIGILVLAALVLGLLVNFALHPTINIHDMVYENSIILSLIFIYLSIYIPIIYKFGAMKGRYLSMMIIVLCAVGGYFLSTGVLSEDVSLSILHVLKNIMDYLPFLAMGLAAVCYVISMYGSRRIYEKKEF